MTETGYDAAEHYDHITDAWGYLLGDELHFGVFEQGDEPLAEATAELTARMIASADLSPGLELLDVGCGTGAPACRLAKEFGVRVLGITTSEVGVEASTERARAEGVEDLVRFEVRDGVANGLPDASFDRVWALESSHLIPDRGALVAECARVLRPQGLFVLCDIVRQREIPFAELRQKLDDFVTLRTAMGNAHLEPLELYLDHARGAGLVVEDSFDLTDVTLPTFARWRENADSHADAVRNAIGDEGFDAFVRSTEILTSMWGDNTLGYALFAARKPGEGNVNRSAAPGA